MQVGFEVNGERVRNDKKVMKENDSVIVIGGPNP